MISQVKICFKHQARIDGRKTIRFLKGINVIVGPNGSGKSSLLEAIYRCSDCKKDFDKNTKYHYFNSETMNPHRFPHRFKGLAGSVIRVRAMFSSHGETMRDVLRNFKFSPGDCFLLDEPEAGHDLEWIIKIYKGLKRINHLGCQIIIASHHSVFLSNVNIIELKRGYLKRITNLERKYVNYDNKRIE